MRYEVLGPVRLVDSTQAYEVNSAKAENLLTSLLLNNERSLSTDQLTYEMWGERPPPRSRAGLHVYISQLRKLIAARDAGSVIETVPPGYRLRLNGDRFDYVDAAEKAGQARAALAQRDAVSAERLSRTALGMWRGAPRRPDTGPILDSFAVSAEEIRLEISEVNTSARVLLGGDDTLINSLHALIAEYPLRESFYSHLMLALHERGRQAEAMLVYQRVCTLLNRELGVTPGPDLRRTHATILSDDGAPGGNRYDVHHILRSG